MYHVFCVYFWEILSVHLLFFLKNISNICSFSCDSFVSLWFATSWKTHVCTLHYLEYIHEIKMLLFSYFTFCVAPAFCGISRNSTFFSMIISPLHENVQQVYVLVNLSCCETILTKMKRNLKHKRQRES